MVIGVTMVKDEADIILDCISNMLSQVDHVIVADNGSTDGTREILAQLPVELVDDDEPAYYQSKKMSRLAYRAMQEGAQWVVPFDADELWYSPQGRIAEVLESQSRWVSEAPMFNHVATGVQNGHSPVENMVWRQRYAESFHKVACRTHPSLCIHEGNHGAYYTHPVESERGLIFIRHFQYRSPEQFLSKVRNGARALELTSLPLDSGQHWRDFGIILNEHGEDAIREIFYQKYYCEHPEDDPDLVHDPFKAAVK
jgi:glycosyltransferase involved in cell wall biosynthesis